VARELADGLADALAVEPVDGGVRAVVHDGWDVFGIPHGGYLLALAASAVLAATGAPDLFTVTAHYLRKAAVGDMDVAVQRIGGSRRFTTVLATGSQEGQVVLAALASVGDREGISGPAWSSETHAPTPPERLGPTAGSEGQPFPVPGVAVRMGTRLDEADLGFAHGRTGSQARIRAVADVGPLDARLGQLAALVACDLTPPAVWNALGATGWVPTVELTAHVRARPADGPLAVDAVTRHVADGFLDEDATVRDATGRLVVQSRQLARLTQPGAAPPG
jgi:hypothetical protein